MTRTTGNPRRLVPPVAPAVRGLGRALAALLLLALPASPGAEAATDPFADLDAINVGFEVGGPLDVQGSTAPELLAGDLARTKRFETSLLRSVGAKLESCGILWDQGAVDEVSISVFGRLEQPRQGPPQYVYMVSLEVFNTELAEERNAVPEPVPLRSVIGVAPDDGVEAAITEAAIAILSDELRNCNE